MKCEDIKLLMIDAIYQEIDPGNRKILDRHLEQCNTCLGEFSSLQATAHLLGQWANNEPKMNLVFLKESNSWFHEFAGRFRFQKLAIGVGIAFASLLLILSLANTRITYQNGDFDLQLSLFESSYDSDQGHNRVTREDMNQFKEENLALIRQLIEANNLQRHQEMELILTKFANDFERKRQADLRLVSSSLNHVQYDAKTRFEHTNRMLNDLIKISTISTGEK